MSNSFSRFSPGRSLHLPLSLRACDLDSTSEYSCAALLPALNLNVNRPVRQIPKTVNVTARFILLLLVDSCAWYEADRQAWRRGQVDGRPHYLIERGDAVQWSSPGHAEKRLRKDQPGGKNFLLMRGGGDNP